MLKACFYIATPSDASAEPPGGFISYLSLPHLKSMQDPRGCFKSVNFSFTPSSIYSVNHQTFIWSLHTRKEKGEKTGPMSILIKRDRKSVV